MDIANEYFELGKKIKDFPILEKIKCLEELYNSLPSPKTDVNNSYLIVKAIGFLSLKESLLDLAEKWGIIGMQYKDIHGFLGEQEFFMGKVYFAKGEMEKAKEYFEKVYKNSKWRLFKGENPEYKKLVQGKL